MRQRFCIGGAAILNQDACEEGTGRIDSCNWQVDADGGRQAVPSRPRSSFETGSVRRSESRVIGKIIRHARALASWTAAGGTIGGRRKTEDEMMTKMKPHNTKADGRGERRRPTQSRRRQSVGGSVSVEPRTDVGVMRNSRDAAEGGRALRTDGRMDGRALAAETKGREGVKAKEI